MGSAYNFIQQQKTNKNNKQQIAVEVPANAVETTVAPVQVTQQKQPAQKQPVQKLKMVNRYGETVEYNPIASTAIKAKITAFSDPQRTQIVKEFGSFVEAKKWLKVTNVGNSLERASETGKMSRGFYWLVV